MIAFNNALFEHETYYGTVRISTTFQWNIPIYTNVIKHRETLELYFVNQRHLDDKSIAKAYLPLRQTAFYYSHEPTLTHTHTYKRNIDCICVINI